MIPATARRGNGKAETGKYDLIILDIMLPTVNRFEILTALRAKKFRLTYSS